MVKAGVGLGDCVHCVRDPVNVTADFCVSTSYQPRLAASGGIKVSLSPQELLVVLEEDICANHHRIRQSKLSA